MFLVFLAMKLDHLTINNIFSVKFLLREIGILKTNFLAQRQ